MAIDIIRRELDRLRPGMQPEECMFAVRKAIETANEQIFQFASEREQYRGMGTTVVVSLATPETVVIGHIGDSRAYKIRKQEVVQLTEDHSLVNELVRSRQITAEEAVMHPLRNVMTRALGTEPTIKVEMNRFTWAPGDVLLLCSDGLSSQLDHGTLLGIIHTETSLEEKAELLIGRALEAGGDDNVTVVLVANEPEQWEGKG